VRELQSGNLAEERQRSCFRDFDLSELACEGGRTVEDDNPVASGSTNKSRQGRSRVAMRFFTRSFDEDFDGFVLSKS
jgi:hypothetical protein